MTRDGARPGEIRLVALNVGKPRWIGAPGAEDGDDEPWESGIFKAPVTGPVRLGRLGLDGDGQADRVNHGGPDKAVNVYSADHHAAWRAELGRSEIGPGAFGENFTIRGATEAEVCLGDVFRVGEALVQITQPRQPCWKLARRWRLPDFAARVEASGRTGWYLRVLAEGVVSAGDRLLLEDRPYPEWPMDRVWSVLRARPLDPEAVATLRDTPVVAESLARSLARRLEGPATG
jgi:MOSC domain-containing protein YiiM